MPASLVLFGDSITQGGWAPGGWASRLAERYVRRADVLNRGLSGYNTRWALAAFPAIFGSSPAIDLSATQSLVTVFFGANDSAVPERNRRQHVPLGEYEANLEAIVTRLTAAGAKVVVITPPPVDPAKWAAYLSEQAGGEAVEPDRRMEVTEQYAAAAKRAAAMCGVPCVDFFAGLRRALGDGWRESLYDGLHIGPSAAGVLYDMLVECIAKNHPDFAVDMGGQERVGNGTTSPLQALCPWHNDLDCDTDVAAMLRLPPPA